MDFPQLANFTPKTLIDASDESFFRNYKQMKAGFNKKIHTAFNSAVYDFDIIRILIFNNDKLEIPPIETFFTFYESILFNINAEDALYSSLLFNNLFKNLFGYNKSLVKSSENIFIEKALYYKIKL